MKFRLLMTTILWLLSLTSYAAEEKIRCESNGGQYRHCTVNTNGNEVTVAKQLSSARCIINDSWGYDDRGVWVDKGCRAEFLVSSSTTTDTRTGTRITDNETFSLRSDNGKCLDIVGADYESRKNGGRVNLWDCHGGKNQRWWFENGALVNSGGKCLDVHRADFDSRANNAKVQLWSCGSDTNQKWSKYQYSQDGKYADTTEVKHVNIFLVKDVRYWVDTNPAWAGVYYPLVGGKCPYGGGYSGGNCLIHRFSKDDDIRRGADYWVRTDTGWAGVYYKQIKDRCPYGGRKVNTLCQILTFN